MFTVLLPPGVYPIAVNKYIISYHTYHFITIHACCSNRIDLFSAKPEPVESHPYGSPYDVPGRKKVSQSSAETEATTRAVGSGEFGELAKSRHLPYGTEENHEKHKSGQ
jgi:hypothetical protein